MKRQEMDGLQGWIEHPNCPNKLAYSFERVLFCLDGDSEEWGIEGWMERPKGLAYSLKKAFFCLDGASKLDGASWVGWNVRVGWSPHCPTGLAESLKRALFSLDSVPRYLLLNCGNCSKKMIWHQIL